MYGMGISWLLVLIYKLALTCKQETSTIVIQNGKMWEKIFSQTLQFME